MSRIAVLITCHNRREKTLACLDALFANRLSNDVSMHVILVDDGSTDGTSEGVRARYPSVEIIKGDGNLYWNNGMHSAFARAMEIGFDAYLWLNDDTILYRTAIESLIHASQEARERGGCSAIVVGSAQDPETGSLTYGGVVAKSRLRPFRYTLVEPGSLPVECHTMNGNCVLVPQNVAQVVGNLDPGFAHAMGDIDYGLRARNAGFKLWVAPGIVGTCPKNTINGTFNDKSLSLGSRWETMMAPKGLPIASWLLLTRRHGGVLWPVFFAWPYLRVLF
jgi:GT2 family glycosyltransferase